MKWPAVILLALSAGFLHADEARYGGSYSVDPGWLYFQKPGKYTAHFRNKNTDVIDVSIQVVSYRERFPRGPKVHVRWGTDGGVPNALIGELNITVGGISAPLQLADFDYLGNPVRLKAWMEKSDCVVELQGGDAGGSYNCFWYFHYEKAWSAYLPFKRLVEAGEFPDDVQESTTFRYNKLEN
jgi:hypothetical protein